ncbi:MAG: rhomboid family intramembrane serine protease [Acidobacteria bacterium]|nr:rhomboid family intramembrane serine protease [Acidobacteriota bacterium]NIM63294.1 rhomboid family intramembrane serine protease [Acidobacteriota bacterium]NIO59141.1 rhomboid family intramembrane serine protease [Acidobacteriota bacterium]NIQ30173.1 rhomboid family intramembrane serine protease [Acidobacteriota bacterium]NIQ85041.1 rhomboid family intramembrane serine protease [Acidobacteriota bacterium]
MNPNKPSLLDSIVEGFAGLLDALGLNGKRLLWKWRQKRFNLGEQGLKTEMAWRAAKAQHKMCRECRALVDRAAKTCPECGATLKGVSTPGLSRSFANMFPGVTAVTGLILLANGFVFLLLMMAHAKADIGFGLFRSFDWELMVRFGGGLSVPYPMADGTVTGGEWWRLVTAIFIHASMMHFFFNSFLLVQLGPLVQEIYRSRFWVIYLLCGLCGSMASQLTRPVMSIGASGAIMGLIGLLLVHGLRNRSQLGQAMKSLLIRLILYTVVLSLVFSIDHRAHAGGFFCGAFLAYVLPGGEIPRSSAWIWNVFSVLGVLLVLVAFGMVGGLGKFF